MRYLNYDWALYFLFRETNGCILKFCIRFWFWPFLIRYGHRPAKIYPNRRRTGIWHNVDFPTWRPQCRNLLPVVALVKSHISERQKLFAHQISKRYLNTYGELRLADYGVRVGSAGARELEAPQMQVWGPLFTDRGVRWFFHRLWVVLWWQTAPKWAWWRSRDILIFWQICVNPFNAICSKLLLFEGFSAILVSPNIFNFWHSGALALSSERQSAQMSKIKRRVRPV